MHCCILLTNERMKHDMVARCLLICLCSELASLSLSQPPLESQDTLGQMKSEDIMQACLLVAKELAMVINEDGRDKASLLVDTTEEARRSSSPHVLLREKIEQLRVAYDIEKALRCLADIQVCICETIASSWMFQKKKKGERRGKKRALLKRKS